MTCITREDYKKKFNQQMKTYNYIPQSGEQIIQCKAPYPCYWFISNKGYLFSAYRKQIKILQPNHRKTGKKSKKGNRAGQDWYYEFRVSGEKHNRHIQAHKLMSEHFLTNQFQSEAEETHHKKKSNTFQPNEQQFCNRADNLQLLPKNIHKEVTKIGGKTNEENDADMLKKMKKAKVEVQLTKEQLEQFVVAALQQCLAQGLEPTLIMTTLDDDITKIETEAYPVKSVEILK